MKQEVQARKLDIKVQVDNRRLDLQEQELLLKQRMDDEKIMNMDLSTIMSCNKYSTPGCKKRSLLDGRVAAVFEIMGLCQLCMFEQFVLFSLVCMNNIYYLPWYV